MTWQNYCERWKTWGMPVAREVETFQAKGLHPKTKPV